MGEADLIKNMGKRQASAASGVANLIDGREMSGEGSTPTGRKDRHFTKATDSGEKALAKAKKKREYTRQFSMLSDWMGPPAGGWGPVFCPASGKFVILSSAKEEWVVLPLYA